jgi:hypothetical protein
MDRLGIEIVGGQIVVDPTRVFHSDEDTSGWAAAAVMAP